MSARCPAVLWAGALVALASGCFRVTIPEDAQIRCSEANPWCPGDMECCANSMCRPKGECEPCGPGGRSCQVRFAIDCDSLSICLDGCWEDCPTCQETCANPDLVTCQLEGYDERWFCRADEICLVRLAGMLQADCHTPPEQCFGPERLNCGCLTAPFAITPPCAPWESCDDHSFSSCVACNLTRTNGNPELDGGLPDAMSLEQPGAPECYTLLGTSSSGASCCSQTGEVAEFASASWDCAGDTVDVFACDGYGDDCMSDTDVSCSADNACLWSWDGPGGRHCAPDGPESPCVAGMWECVPGSSPPVECDCFTTNDQGLVPECQP